MIRLEVPLIGVKVLEDSVDLFSDAASYRGVSYCDAVRRAALGEELLVTPGAVEVCRWSPIVLGLKNPESSFERSLEPRLTGRTAGVYVAMLSRFPEGVEPDVVIVRGRPAQLRKLTAAVGEGALQQKYRGMIGLTALGVGEERLSLRVMLVHAVNYTLSVLERSKRFDRLTRTLFKRESVSRVFEKVAKNTLADMSMCRNATVLPYLENAGNISFFCTGGVIWGGNSPANMTSGFPFRCIKPLLDDIEDRLL